MSYHLSLNDFGLNYVTTEYYLVGLLVYPDIVFVCLYFIYSLFPFIRNIHIFRKSPYFFVNAIICVAILCTKGNLKIFSRVFCSELNSNLMKLLKLIIK